MDDYGLFGKGPTGYAHYMTAVNRIEKSGGGGGGGCLTATIMMISVIACIIIIPILCIF